MSNSIWIPHTPVEDLQNISYSWSVNSKSKSSFDPSKSYLLPLW